MLEYSLVDKRVASLHLLAIVCTYAPNVPSFLGVAGWGALSGDVTVQLEDFNADMGDDTVTWKGVIGRNDQPDLNPSGVLFLDFFANHNLSITSTMFTVHVQWPLMGGL